MQILRAKYHRPQRAKIVGQTADRLFVDRQLALIGRPIIANVTLRLTKCYAPGKKSRSPVMNDLRVANAPERAQSREKINRLQQVGFALGIAPKQQVKPRLKPDLEFPVIPEITKFELGQVHAASWPEPPSRYESKPLKTKQSPHLRHQLKVSHNKASFFIHITLVHNNKKF